MTKETDTKIKITLSSEVMSFIEVFRQKAQVQKIEPDVILSPRAHDRLLRWLQKTIEEKQIQTLQKYFCSNWSSIVTQYYSLQAFANTCNILRVEQS